MAEAKSFKDLPLLYNKGASSALRANTYPDDAKDVIPITHAPNTTEQQDYAVPLSQIGVSTVGTCDTSANTQTKIVDVISGSFPFNTENSDEAIGRNILVKFINKNTANNPKIKIGNIEAKSIVCIGGTATVGSGCWEAGATMKFTFDGENWLMHSNVASKTESYTILADGTTVYNKAQTDSTINGALADLDKLSLTTVQDANLCISNTEGLKIFKCSGVNCPNNDDGIIITFTQKYANTYYKQIWYNDTDISSFIRFGKKVPNTDIVWSAWEKFESINKVFNLTTYAYNKVHEYIKDNWNNIPIGKSNYELATNATGTANYTVCEVTKQSDTFGEVLVHSYYGDLVMINYNGVWNIQKVVTENNLINSLAGATTTSKFPIAKASLSSYMPFKLYLLGGSNHLIIVEGTLSNWNGTVTAFVNVKSDLVSNVSYDNTNEQLVVTTSETCYLGKISIFNTDTWCSIP